MSEPRDPVTPAPDRLVGGRYRLGPVLGRGGMATVHRATDIRLERDVAVKLLRPEVTQDRDLAQRFRREALAATVLRHPNIVACLDTGTDEGQPYLVMELVDGEDLAARLKRGGRLSPWQVARIGLDVARALGVAHVRGIVHRDVKPGNILLAADGRAMVTDFGIARLAMDAEASMPGTTLGSVHYFSPEQARGATTTPASDVYGLGLVLYEALTGVRAWSGDSTDAIALARVGATAPSVLAARPEVPSALADVVARALAPEAPDRFPNGAAMAVALEAIVVAGANAGHRPSSGDAGEPAVGETGAPMPQPARPAPAAAAEPVPDAAPAPPRPTPSRVRTTSAGRGGARGTGLPVGLGALFVILGLAGLALGATGMAVLPGVEPGSVDETEPPFEATPRPRETPVAEVTPDPEPAATPRPTESAEPTEPPTPLPDGTVADLCQTFFDLPCGMGAGRYAPSRFVPAVSFEIEDGWSTQAHAEDVVVLSREEGFLSTLSGVGGMGGVAVDDGDGPRSAIEALVTMDGVAAREPAEVRIDSARGFSVDLSPIGSDRLPIVDTAGGSTYYLEPDRLTRVVALDVDGRLLVLIIEPADDVDLRTILDIADPVAGTMQFR